LAQTALRTDDTTEARTARGDLTGRKTAALRSPHGSGGGARHRKDVRAGSRVYTDRVAHPIEVDIRACAGGNAGARVRADVAGMGPASLR